MKRNVLSLKEQSDDPGVDKKSMSIELASVGSERDQLNGKLVSHQR